MENAEHLNAADQHSESWQKSAQMSTAEQFEPLTKLHPIVSEDVYYPVELLGAPPFIDADLLLSMISRFVSTFWELLTTLMFFWAIAAVDIAISLINIVMPARQRTVDHPQAAKRQPHKHFWRHPGGRHKSSYRQGREVIPTAFSPEQPPNFFHAPLTCILCHAAAIVGTETRYCPNWLRWWSHWQGHGYHGKWSTPLWPEDTDSRGPCPALNAMANHGILPHDGRHITPHQLASTVARTFNLSPTLALRITWIAKPLWKNRGEFDLSDLAAHNVVEHDASLLRPDANSIQQAGDAFAQCHPWPDLVDAFLPTSEVYRAAFGEDAEERARRQWDNAGDWHHADSKHVKLSAANLSHAISVRRSRCTHENGQYSQPIFMKMFGSLKLVLLLDTFGGRLQDLRSITGGNFYGKSHTKYALHERNFSGLEHFPTYPWQPENHQYYGRTGMVNLIRGLFVEAMTEPTTGRRAIDQAELTQAYLGEEASQIASVIRVPEEETAEETVQPIGGREDGQGSEDTLHEAWLSRGREPSQPKVKEVAFAGMESSTGQGAPVA